MTLVLQRSRGSRRASHDEQERRPPSAKKVCAESAWHPSLKGRRYTSDLSSQQLRSYGRSCPDGGSCAYDDAQHRGRSLECVVITPRRKGRHRLTSHAVLTSTVLVLMMIIPGAYAAAGRSAGSSGSSPREVAQRARCRTPRRLSASLPGRTGLTLYYGGLVRAKNILSVINSCVWVVSTRHATNTTRLPPCLLRSRAARCCLLCPSAGTLGVGAIKGFVPPRRQMYIFHDVPRRHLRHHRTRKYPVGALWLFNQLLHQRECVV